MMGQDNGNNEVVIWHAWSAQRRSRFKKGKCQRENQSSSAGPSCFLRPREGDTTLDRSLRIKRDKYMIAMTTVACFPQFFLFFTWVSKAVYEKNDVSLESVIIASSRVNATISQRHREMCCTEVNRCDELTDKERRRGAGAGLLGNEGFAPTSELCFSLGSFFPPLESSSIREEAHNSCLDLVAVTRHTQAEMRCDDYLLAFRSLTGLGMARVQSPQYDPQVAVPIHFQEVKDTPIDGYSSEPCGVCFHSRVGAPNPCAATAVYVSQLGASSIDSDTNNAHTRMGKVWLIGKKKRGGAEAKDRTIDALASRTLKMFRAVGFREKDKPRRRVYGILA
ncbi:hypothetical protein H4582DRAFT_2129787 [Lactarius indigo]|nr:hypothetical protein H4582DRAFT_2129787 [Lactarius indigo]